MAGDVREKGASSGRGSARAPVIAAFSGCGLARLRGLVESLALSVARGWEGAREPEWIDGLSESEGRTDPWEVAAGLAGRRVVLLCRDPREAVLENYRRYRVERRSIGASLDDLLCARPAGTGPLTPEVRLGLRACVDFMSAMVREESSFESLTVVHASELERDAWGQVRRVVEFLGLEASEEDYARAGRRAGPLARSFGANGGANGEVEAGGSRFARTVPLALSSGQRVFADDLIAEHLHPSLARYKTGVRRAARRAA